MVQIQHNQDFFAEPKHASLDHEGARARMNEIEQKVLFLIEDSISGDVSRVGTIAAQIDPKKKMELELIAHIIIQKALEEPQHCNACVSLSGALHMLLPALPSAKPGKKSETFMHALLDVFQMKFEDVFYGPPGQTFQENETGSGSGATQRNQNRIRAIVHFAGHLYCHKLLGSGVVRQMVQDIVDNGESESANELLWFIGVATKNAERRSGATKLNLGTVLEDVGDSDGGSSEAISTAERRPSCS